ncbi:MAG TPA: 4'-phosphopantetheinyl transferase superfamily protein [Prolixibacteraceae bacterium]|nr:4'-phosphopantetheinyl transferase superfamily protein [Prolixibacteraceae bacterium]HPS12274.1 4'-phosphopantetheinyl transferase superfamily protein [Prolixibacteraceae bacterium]
MPLILNRYENSFRLALWKLTEPLEFFEEKAHLTTFGQQFYSQITNECRKKEWLAVRILLNEVLGFWPNITYMESGKPILNNHARHLSITHSKEMVGILLCTSPYAGIDIEKASRNIDKVLNRFLSEKELENIKKGTNPYRKVIHWCAKEAIFKSVNEPNIEFSKQIEIKSISDNGTILGKFTSEKAEFDLELNYMLVEGHIIVWTT